MAVRGVISGQRDLHDCVSSQIHCGKINSIAVTTEMDNTTTVTNYCNINTNTNTYSNSNTSTLLSRSLLYFASSEPDFIVLF